MCEASNFRKIHSYICITCYLLCVFFDVHLHGVKCAAKSAISSRYDSVVKSGAYPPNEYHIVRTKRSSNFSFICKGNIASNESHFFKNHLDSIIQSLTPNKNDKEANSTTSNGGVALLNKLLKSIGIGKLRSPDDDEHGHAHEEHKEEKLDKGKEDENEKIAYVNSECLSAEEIYQKMNLPKYCAMQPKQFQEICPSLIFQLSQKSCEKTKESLSQAGASAGAIWGCSTAAVIVISMVGLFAVAIIPFMKKGFYDVLVQFLIAVGVGTLTGDAVLHLIPHALVSHDHGDESSKNSDREMQMTVFKSSMALVGAHVFFVTERLTTMFQSYRVRRRIRRKAKKSESQRDVDTETGKYALVRSANRNGHKRASEVALVNTPGSSAPTDVTSIGGSGFDLETKPTSVSVVTDGSDHGHGHSHGHCNSRLTDSDCNVVADEANRLMHHTTVHHCHSHDFSSIKAIAWTVIMGDGLHNFCDGVAIGAAFANNLRGGLSTSIAVIWHELPHEIGDFAVLLQAGMSVKMALFYNILSSIFCFGGMVIGITVGGMHEVTPWVFMLAAGMFLYIAFVDMLPNLTCDQVDEKGQPTNDSTKAHRKLVFFVQNAGILLGYAVMFLIALYEDKIFS